MSHNPVPNEEKVCVTCSLNFGPPWSPLGALFQHCESPLRAPRGLQQRPTVKTHLTQSDSLFKVWPSRDLFKAKGGSAGFVASVWGPSQRRRGALLEPCWASPRRPGTAKRGRGGPPGAPIGPVEPLREGTARPGRAPFHAMFSQPSPYSSYTPMQPRAAGRGRVAGRRTHKLY